MPWSDVQRCLESIIHHTTHPYALILVDDGSDAPTQDFVRDFATQHGAVVLHNETPMGYGRAANQGLRHSSAEYALLLNSDTIVTPGWLDKLVCCAESNPQHGLIGPLSNTASWQSIPEVLENDDWASNQLPDGVDVDEMARRVARYSARLYPTVPFLNGFCYMIRRRVIEQIGYFDEENFGAGYGEEDDYTLRARQADWLAAVADDTYIYHAQSRSYSHERRRQLTERAGKILAQKHGQQVIDEGNGFWLHNKVFEGIRGM